MNYSNYSNHYLPEFSVQLVYNKDGIQSNIPNKEETGKIKKQQAEFSKVLDDMLPESKYKDEVCNTSVRKSIPCKSLKEDPVKSQEDTLNNIEKHIENISNLDKAGYKKTTSYRDKDGNIITDNTPGKVLRSDRYLDFAVSGYGKGFKLEDGSYTRDGRFVFNKEGRLVTKDKNIPVVIDLEHDVEPDWSMKEFIVRFDGRMFDKLNGKYIGKIRSHLADGARIAQGYTESSNVNIPLELIELRRQLSLLDAQRQFYSTNVSLDKEAVSIARNVI